MNSLSSLFFIALFLTLRLANGAPLSVRQSGLVTLPVPNCPLQLSPAQQINCVTNCNTYLSSIGGPVMLDNDANGNPTIDTMNAACDPATLGISIDQCSYCVIAEGGNVEPSFGSDSTTLQALEDLAAWYNTCQVYATSGASAALTYITGNPSIAYPDSICDVI